MTAIQHHLQLADEIRQLQAENARLKNELKETEGFLLGVLLTNQGELKYRSDNAILIAGHRQGIQTLIEKGLSYIQGSGKLHLTLNGNGPYTWDGVKSTFPELFK